MESSKDSETQLCWFLREPGDAAEEERPLWQLKVRGVFLSWFLLQPC